MLIQTKLQIPSFGAGILLRPGLLAALDGATVRRLTLAEAPAGFGKTVLLAQWAGQIAGSDRTVAWFTAEPADNRIDRFMSYLIGALHRADAALARDLPALIETAPNPPVETLLASLVNVLANHPRDVCLVIDDFHHLDAPEIGDFVQALLSHAPRQLHLLLATRTAQGVRLAGLRARGQLIHLDENALRFTLAETGRLLNGSRELGLTDVEIALVQHRTEGWAAALNLAGLSLEDRAGRSEFLRRFSGAEGAVADFLAQEVLASLDGDLLDFLLRTSILDRFTAPLADAVTGQGNAAAMIARIEAANLFLMPLDRDREWFRYHALFAELLRGVLARRMRQSVPNLHLAAARWLAGAGQTSDAVDQALLAGDSALAAELVRQACMPMIMSRSIAQVRDWLSRLPEAVINAHPRLMLAQVWVYFHSSRPHEGVRVLGRARRAIARQIEDGRLDAADAAELGAEIRVLNAGVLSAADHSKLALVMAERCLPEIPGQYHFLAGVLLNVMAFCHYSLGHLAEARRACVLALERHALAPSAFGTVYSELILGLVEKAAGQLDAAQSRFARATTLARDSEGPGSYSEAMVGIFEAEILYERGDLASVEAMVARHRPLIAECGLVVHDLACTLLMARLSAAAGRTDEAMARLEATERQGLKARYRRLFAGALHERIKLLVARGDVEMARLILTTRGVDEAWLTDARALRPVSEFEHVALARVLIAEDRAPTALRLLDRLADAIRRDGRTRRLAQVRALAAIAAYRSDEPVAALGAIAEAVGLTAPHLALRSLVDEGSAIRDVMMFGLERIPAWRRSGSTQRAFVESVLAAIPAAAGQPATPRHPDMSPREGEVARLLALGYANREIGVELAMAPDTVKWHLKNIYGKLGAANRTQAVLKLQQIGLAP